ncbi:membrane protein [Shewanella sairae]|uniref:Membrane protein n=1 Tax=Shewanella sairae TaxID=190310 RepID=A0ABQ4P7S1_9GAMM|nr:outer membrane protein OmpK [Shewanella sairae]MCL1130423.1 outer membrane protein OmpK [Shewanella sairae]GIU43585.1 membrane protein [Shewanella sairae]
MKNVKTFALAATAIAATMSAPTFAADRTDLRAGDYSWMQFNAMYAVNELPRDGSTDNGHDYLEMEFGGRAGIVDLYGYVDVFNVTNRDYGDKGAGKGASKLFMKFAPRFSIDAMTGMDLSVGPIQEVYFSTLFNWDDRVGEGVNSTFWGLGADVMVPWLGKTGMNVYAYYDLNAKEWNGYQFSMNWFKPVVNFDNGTFISFQGYVDYQFGADAVDDAFVPKTTNGGAAYFGLHWHSDNYALGYGLKGYKDVYLVEDDGGIVGLESTGFAHYFTATYKF